MTRVRFSRIVLALVLLVTWGFVPAATAAGQSLAQAEKPDGPGEFILLPSMPDLENVNIPSRMNPHQAEDFARSLLKSQARPALRELRSYQEQGLIGGYELQPESGMVSVEGDAPILKEQLSTLQGVAGLSAGPEGSACVEQTVSALASQVRARSYLQESRGQAPDSVEATDPSIFVNLADGWSGIWGRTTVNTPVSVRILRNAIQIALEETTSYSDGYYSFYPDWTGSTCSGGGGYSWLLQPGDVVEVTAHGSTVSTIAVYINAWTNPINNTVEGQTDPGRSLEVDLYYPSANYCYWNVSGQITSADGSGHFLVNMPVDFNGQADAEIYALDANGNGTVIIREAFSIYTDFSEYPSISFTLKPSLPFNLTISRGSIVTYSSSGVTAGDGWAYTYLEVEVQPGDIITVSGGGITLNYTTTFLEVTIDHVTYNATGTTGPGRTVLADFYSQNISNGYFGCSSNYTCATGTADGNGVFTLHSEYDLLRGDYAYITVIDASGNQQRSSRTHITALIADLNNDAVYGFWEKPGAYTTLTLRDAGANVLETISLVWADSWEGSIYEEFSHTLLPGYSITISDGTASSTMNIQNLTANLDSASDHLSITGPDWPVTSTLWNYDRYSNAYYIDCAEVNINGGSASIDYSTNPVAGNDYADVYLRLPGGHYINRWAHAFTIEAYNYSSGTVGGYTSLPNTPVTIKVFDGGSQKGSTVVLNSGPSGYYRGYVGVSIVAGNRVEVTAGAASPVSMIAPALSLSRDIPGNRLYGTAPANEPVGVILWKYTACGKSYSCWRSFLDTSAADGAGNFSVNYNGRNWSNDCALVNVGGQCTDIGVNHYNAEEYFYRWEGVYPPDAPADSYEADNTSAAAKAYAGRSSHSFHISTDVDWVSFTVSPADKNKHYQLFTLNLGSTADTIVEVYAPDGTTRLAQDDDSGGGYASRVSWIPGAAGTYYARIVPFSSVSTDNCGSSYDFEITSQFKVFVPLTQR